MRKSIKASLKLKITLEAIKGDMTIGELATRYEVSPAQIHRWKRLLLAQGSELFEGAKKASSAGHEEEIQKLHANIGRLTVENDFLSRALGRLK